MPALNSQITHGDRGISLKQTVTDNARERLLDRSEMLFAQKGFAAVSVREITSSANCNLSAVNYYFGNKMNLYISVFKERWIPRMKQVRQYAEDYLSGRQTIGISDVIRSLAMSFLEGPMTDTERIYHFHLMQREITHPTEALNLVVDEIIRPMHNNLQELIKPFLPEELSTEKLALSIFTTSSMVLYFGFARPVVSRVMDQEFDQAFKSRVIDHIVSFAMNGMNGLKKEETI